MKNLTNHVGTLKIIKRLKKSRDGNPRFYCAIVDQAGTGFTFKTRPDSMTAYGLEQYDGEPVVLTLGTYYGQCTLASIAHKPAYL